MTARESGPAKAEQKRRSHDAILDTAERLLHERGIVGAGVADVVHGAGLTVDGFHAHFASKTALVDAALRRALATLRDLPLTGLDDHSATDRAEDRHAEDRHAEDRHAEDRHAGNRHAGNRHAGNRHAENRHAENRHAENPHAENPHAEDRHAEGGCPDGGHAERVIERYFSAHRDDATAGCPLPAVVGEVATAAPTHHDALRDHLDALAPTLEPHLPGAGQPSLPCRQLALGLIALLYGGLALSRAVRGSAPNEILHAGRALGRIAADFDRASH